MKKNLFVALFLVVIVFVASKAFIALFSYQAAEKLKQSLNADVAITYSWLSSELDGTVVYHDVSITPYHLKRTFYIDRLKLNYGNYLNLLINLPNFSSGKHDGLQSVIANSVKGKLEGRDFEEWIALEYGEDFSNPLSLYACGEQKRVSHHNLREMGIHDYNASITIKKRDAADPSTLGLSILIERGPLGDTEVNTTWDAFSIPADLPSWKLQTFKLNDLSLTHVDNGFFRRLSNFCSTFNQLGRAEFSDRASKSWQKGLNSIGLDADDNLRALYRDYLTQGGQLKFSLSPAKPFVFDQFKELLDKDLFSYLGVKAQLNNKEILGASLKVNRQHFIPPPAVIEDTTEKDESTLEQKNGYLPISLEALEQSIQKKVRLETLDGKKHEGLVVSVDKYKMELGKMVAGGSVVYEFQRDQIKSVDMWH